MLATPVGENRGGWHGVRESARGTQGASEEAFRMRKPRPLFLIVAMRNGMALLEVHTGRDSSAE